MPLYEYRCRDCGARFERLVRSTTSATTVANADTRQGASTATAPAIVCPDCGSTEVGRLLSAFARTAPACAPAASGGG